MQEAELRDIDQVELSLTGTPAVKEGFIMTKSDKNKKKTDEELRTEFAKLDEDALFVLYKAQEEEEDEEEEDDDDKKKKPKKAPPEFNFDKADEPTKVALRAVGEALTNLGGLPESVAEFAKSIKDKLPAPDNGKKGTEDLIAFAKSNFPGMVEAIQKPMQEQLDAVKKTAEELQTERELTEMRKVAEELPGDPDVTAKRLLAIRKSLSEEDFEAYIEEQKGMKNEVVKSALMSRVSSAQPAAGSAEAIVLNKAEGIVAKSTHGIKTMIEAIEFVGKTDPVLWGRYQEEVRNRPASVRAA